MEGQFDFRYNIVLRWSRIPYLWGEQYLSSGTAGLLNSTIPIWVTVLTYVIYKWIKKSTKSLDSSQKTFLGLACGFGGLMLLVAEEITSGDMNPIGGIALIISSISWALGSIYSTKAKLPVSILASMITGGLMLIGTSFVLR
jgi:drug/metabolite transporter (DMT)-like permease